MDTEGGLILSSPSQAQTVLSKYVQELAISGEEPPQKYIHKDIVNVKGQQVTTDDTISVPIIDISRLTTNASMEEKEEEMEKLKSALKSWGMFRAIGHAIPQNLLDDMYNVSKHFFELPVEDKKKYAACEGDGVLDLEGFGSDFLMPSTDDDNKVLDWKDYLALIIEPVEERKLQFWPGDDFRRALDEYSVHTRLLMEIILRAMSKSLGLEENEFINQMGDRPSVSTLINFYPPCARPDLVYGIRPHTDGGVISILLQDPEVQGLQVLKNDQWVSVPCMPGALLVNVSDELHLMSNGIFKSPLHRAVTNTERKRISLGVFYSAHTDKEIEPVAALIDENNPRKYRKVKVKDFLEAFRQSYIQGNRVYDWASI